MIANRNENTVVPKCLERISYVNYMKSTLLSVNRPLLIHGFIFFQLWILPCIFKEKDKCTRGSGLSSKKGSKHRVIEEERLSPWVWLVWIGANWREQLSSKITAKKIIKTVPLQIKQVKILHRDRNSKTWTQGVNQRCYSSLTFEHFPLWNLDILFVYLKSLRYLTENALDSAIMFSLLFFVKVEISITSLTSMYSFS